MLLPRRLRHAAAAAARTAARAPTRTRASYPGHLPTNPLQKIVAAGAAAALALADPARADMVGLLGEATGRVALERIRARLRSTDEGREILKARPIVTATEADAAALRRDCAAGTFGRAYGEFMGKHGFDADDRAPVQLVDDEELAYVLLRYRQVHDYWHVLFGLPPSVHGELALKWFELIHTGLPLAAFSALSAPFTLAPEKRRKLHETHVPWALEAGAAATPLLAVYYEKHWHRDLDALRSELGVIVAPPLKS